MGYELMFYLIFLPEPIEQLQEGEANWRENTTTTDLETKVQGIRVHVGTCITNHHEC